MNSILKLSVIVILFCLSHSFASAYAIGDTLYVVALDGVNLRDAVGTKSNVLTKLNNGESVIVKSKELEADSSFGFAGHWVEVFSIDHKKTGYVFDAFISRFPVLSKEQINPDGGIPNAIYNYAKEAFGIKYEMSQFYESLSGGEGAHRITLTELNNSCLFVKHGYWESNGVELDIPGARTSEIYYLIWNMIKYFNKHTIDQFNPDIKTTLGPQSEGRIVVVSESDYEWSLYYARKLGGRVGIFFSEGY